MKSTSSISVVQPIVIYLSFFCVVPWYNFKMRKLMHTKIFKCYLILLAIATLALSFFQLFERFRAFYPNTSTVFALEDFISETAGLSLFLATVLGSTFWNSMKWERLFVQLRNVEDSIALFSKDKERCTTNKVFYFFFALGNIYLICLYGLDFVRFSTHYDIYFYFLSTQIFRYIGFISSYIVASVAVIIKQRYEEINWICHRDSKILRARFIKTLGNVKKLYLEMLQVTQIFSKLFGWPILCLYSYSVVQILNCLSFLTKKKNFDGTEYHYRFALCIHLLYVFEIMVSFISKN